MRHRKGTGRIALRSKNRSRQKRADVYKTMGALQVRLAQSHAEVRCAQHLRYRVFYEEMSAVPSAAMRMKRRDVDAYDTICDHLLVCHDGGSAPNACEEADAHHEKHSRIVGTYRMLRQDIAEQNQGFYSQNEFDLDALIACRGPQERFLELGRSCVLQPYRDRPTMELLWHGLWSYIRKHDITAMVGCASFEGTDPQVHAEALSFLHHNAMAPEDWRVSAHDGLKVDMNMVSAHGIDHRNALRNLPPLIKGYLRLGCFVGDGAVVDRQFGTTDVLIVLPVSRINPRYFAHFGQPNSHASRTAAHDPA